MTTNKAYGSNGEVFFSAGIGGVGGSPRSYVLLIDGEGVPRPIGSQAARSIAAILLAAAEQVDIINATLDKK